MSGADVLEREPWARLPTRGHVFIFTRTALRARGVLAFENQYLVAVDNAGKMLSIAVSTVTDLQTLIPTLAPVKLEIFCLRSEHEELRGIAAAVKSVNEFVESLA